MREYIPTLIPREEAIGGLAREIHMDLALVLKTEDGYMKAVEAMQRGLYNGKSFFKEKIYEGIKLEIIDLKDWFPMISTEETIFPVYYKGIDLYGSGAMFHPELAMELAKKGMKEYYIIPSSRDEIIVVPYLAGGAKDLYRANIDINKDFINTKLVDNLYFYSGDSYFEIDKGGEE